MAWRCPHHPLGSMGSLKSMRSWRSLVGILAIVVAACGGGETGGNPLRATEDPGERMEIDDEVARVAATVVEDLGDAGAIDALLFALERGYSIDQLLSIGLDGIALDRAGMVTGPAGIVDPELGFLGLIELPDGPNAAGAPIGVLVVYRPPQIVVGGQVGPGEELRVDVEGLRGAAQRLVAGGTLPWQVVPDRIGEAVVSSILMFAENGYSGDQIVEVLTLGGRGLVVSGCFVLEIGGEPVVPAKDPVRRPGCKELLEIIVREAGGSTTSTSEVIEGEPTIETTTSESQIAFPRTYVGTGSYTLSYTFASGSCSVDGQILEVTLREDGTLGGTYDVLNPTFGWNKQLDGSFEMDCTGHSAVEARALSGTHTPPAPDTGGRGHVSVHLTDAPESLFNLEGEYTSDEMIFQWRTESDTVEFQDLSGVAHVDTEFMLIPTDG